jgi:hypothetical protein
LKRVEAPDWLYVARCFNPLTYLVEAERALFMGEVFTWPVLYGALVALAVAVDRPRHQHQPDPEGLAETRRPSPVSR